MRTSLAIARMLRIGFCFRVLHQPTRVRIGDRSVMRAYPRRWITIKAAFANPPDYREMLYWKRYLKPDDTFIDVGANVGSYSIWAAELGARVIALEPADDTYELLNENIRLNGYEVRTIKAAAGSTSGTVRFTRGLDDVNRMDEVGDIEVEAVTLDSIIGNSEIAGMKIDVEGFELEVLRGCEHALSQQRIALIQLEWNTTSLRATNSDRSPVADLLRKYGYGLFRPDSNGELIPFSNLSFGDDVFACPIASTETA
jgi:FkbM family methyltransferase